MFETETIEGDAPAVERSEEFEAFRRLVRSRAIMARDSMGWPAAEMNETLVTLGLEPIEAWVVSVDLTATQTYTREIGTGRRTRITSREEAVKQVVDMDDATLVESVPYTAWKITERTEPRVVVPGVEGVEPDPAAVGDDLTAYKRLVRRIGIQVAKKRGWCDSGTNEYLVALGLPSIQTFQVPVDVEVRQRILVPVREAESLEEARALLAAGGEPATVQEYIQANVSRAATVVGHQVPEPPNPDDMSVGDVDGTLAATSTDGYRHWCRTRNPGVNGYECSLPTGHDGHQHVAGNGTRVVSVWPI